MASLNILIVDDSQSLLQLLDQQVESLGHKSVSISDPRQIETTLAKHKFDLAIVDLKMPEISGTEALKIIQDQAKIPVIMMTGFSDAMDADEAHRLGASDFLLKPFSEEELGAAIALLASRDEEEAYELKVSDEYCPVSIHEFLSGTTLGTDIYVKLDTKSKYLKVARKGNQLAKNRVDTYVKKGLRYFYVTPDDFKYYMDFNIKLSGAAMKRQDLSRDKKLHLLKHSIQNIVADSYINGVDREAFTVATQLVTSTLDVLKEGKGAVELLDIMQAHSMPNFTHSAAASLYSCMLAKEVGWTSPPTLIKLSMAGLFHDIGLKEISGEILEKPRALRSDAEMRIYENHPNRSAEILRSLGWVPEEVITIVQHHHENLVGSGYPLGLPRLRIHPLALILGLVDMFCDLAIESSESDGGSPHSAITRIYESYRECYNTKHLIGLMKLFDYPIPKDLYKQSVNKIK